MLQIKVVKDSILYKEVSEPMCQSPTEVELGPPKIAIFKML